MKYLFIILWFAVFAKKMLFWVWLWQLKEYHLGRFKVHFQTAKGKKIIFNYLLVLKLFLAPFLFFYVYDFFWFLLLIFSLEFLSLLLRFFRRTLKIPVLTKKTILILTTGLLLEILIIYYLLPLSENVFYFSLLILDIFAPLIFSALVLALEPMAIFWRNKIIKQATEKREEFKNLIVIGITGSYGKTSTKEILDTILNEKFKVLKTKEHHNSEVGISQCVLNELESEHQIFICEMGAYKKEGIKLLTGIVKPKIGILTGINEQHLATFGSLENIIKTKYELIESLPPDGLGVFNGNNKYCLNLFEKTNIAKKITNKDIWAEDIKVEKEFISFRVRTNDNSADFKVNLLGSHWIENILMAVLVAKELGMSLEEISQNCLKIKPFSGAMKLVRNPDGLNIIDATYSANPDGIISHLDYLKIWPGKKIIVMPCLIELGKSVAEVHQKIGEKIKEACDLAIITTKECFEDMNYPRQSEGIPSGASSSIPTSRDRKKEKTGEGKILFLENPKDIYKKIKDFSGKEDIILLESRLPKELLNLLGVK